MALTKKQKQTAVTAARIDDETKDWKQYKSGISYKTQIGLYTKIDDNYRFFIGDQWHGVDAKNLPQPVFNFIKQIVRYKVATVMTNDTKILYGPILTGDREIDEAGRAVCADLTRHAAVLWEKLKLDYFNEMLVTDGAVSGSAFSYWYFKRNTRPMPEKRKRKASDKKDKNSERKENEYAVSTGETAFDIVDVNNIFPGDVNTPDIQNQPYIIISFRRHITDVKRKARANKKDGLCDMTLEQIDRISGDSDYLYEAGDTGKKELDDGELTKITCLLKMWRDEESGTIHMRESTRSDVIMKDYDSELTRYPLASFLWEPVKNSFFGQSDITGIIPNQKFTNKAAAMMMLSTMYNAFPKMVYDREMVDNPSNKIGEAIAVSGTNGAPIRGVIDYIAPPAISSDAFSMFNATINLTKDLMSASDAALGTANTTSASGKAILSQIAAAARPLETTRRRFYSYVEDIGAILFDMWRVYQGDVGKKFALRNEQTGEEEFHELSPKDFYNLDATTRIEVGPATRWNEPAVMETLDKLLTGGFIDFERWAKSVPDNYGLPKQDILNDIAAKKNEAAAQGQSAQEPASAQGSQSAQRAQGAQRGAANTDPERSTDEQVVQLASAVQSMEPARARAAIEQISAKSANLAARVLSALPAETISAIKSAVSK